MAQPYIGEIRLFAGNFAPVDWALCDGSSLPISGYETLYNLIGTTYGGNGTTNFNLPDLRSRVPVHQGTSPSGTYVLGQPGGVESVSLTSQQIPAHSHPLNATAASQQASPANALPAVVASGQTGANVYGTATALPTTLLPQTVSPAGNSVPHNNIQPFVSVTFIIALFGIYPSQN